MPVFNLQNLGQSIVNLPEATLMPYAPATSVTVTALSAAAIASYARNEIGISPTPSQVATPAPDAPVVQAVALAAGVAAVNLDLGTVVTIALNANMTLQNPTFLAQSRYVGMELTYLIAKDATAGTYTFTYGSQFKGTTITAAPATASAKNQLVFAWDGLNWVQKSVNGTWYV